MVILGLSSDEQLELIEQGIVEADQGQVGFNAGLDGRISKAFSDTGAIGLVGDLFADLRQVVLTVGVLDMSQKIAVLRGSMIPVAYVYPRPAAAPYLSDAQTGAAAPDALSWESMRSFLALPPWMAFI